MSVRAKFKVVELKRTLSGNAEQVTVVMSPVTSGSEENKSFWKYTPSGRLELVCVNAAATEQFELGREYYLDFSPAVAG